VNEWKRRGLSPAVEVHGIRRWNDLCVVDSRNGLTLPCEWIEVDLDEQIAWLKGTPRGEVSGRPSGEHGGIPLGP
jgi:hypothetical protein